MPEVSVLIPVYNTARFLPMAMESILGQRYRGFELIALDDGSSDESPAILERFAKRDSRVRVIKRERRGLVETRNELVGEARGKYIAWMDSDDLSTPQRLGLQLARFHREPEMVCLGGCWMLIDPEGMPIRIHVFPREHEEVVAAMEEEIAVGFGCSMMLREAVVRVGGFRHPFVISEDFDLCLRLAEVGRMANLGEVILYYRQHMESTVNAGRPRSYVYSRFARELARERKLFGQDRLQRGEKVEVKFETEPTKKENLKETVARWAWWALGEGHVRTARKYALKTFGYAPLSLESWRLAYCALRGY